MLNRGSYTIEAAVITPIMIFTMALSIRMAIYLYEEIQEYKISQELEELWEVDEFYKYQILKGVIDD